MLKFVSLFTGIGGFDLGFERTGMQCVMQVERDEACLKLLARHWPKVKRMDDVRKVKRITADLVCGGFPCQDVSVAGKREGLAGERSGLWFEFHRIIERNLPRWVVIENVPGLLSSNEGRDFAAILRGLVKCGYGVSWRILDSRYFGVAQRRRRVFIVGSLGSGRSAEILFEREGVSGDITEGGQAGQVSATLFAIGAGTSRPAGTASETDFLVARSQTSRNERNDGESENFVVARPLAHSSTMNHYDASQQTYIASTLKSGGKGNVPSSRGENIIAFTARDYGNDVAENISPTMRSLTVGEDGHQSGGAGIAVAIAPTLEAEYFKKRYSNQQFFSQNGDGFPVESTGVRRLTPTECERLQGFPDGWTDGQADSTRYRQLGNAVTVDVLEWIGRRIVAMESSC